MKRNIKNLQATNIWIIVSLTVFFGMISVFSLRANNIEAVKLRNNVMEVDKNNGDIETALRKLQSFIYSHMNTNLATNTNVYPPIQLKYRYERLVASEKERVDQANAHVYTQAYQLCEQRFPNDFSGQNRLPCVDQYVATNGATEKAIPEDVYKFNFASPKWTPDLAGISMVLAILSAIYAGILLLAKWLIKTRIL